MSPRSRCGITLIELIVVIGIISILTGLVLAGVQRVRTASDRVACGNQSRQIGLALHQYHQAHGHFPAGTYSPKTEHPWMSWRVAITPYLEQDRVWLNAVADYQREKYPWAIHGEHVGVSRSVSAFYCPSEPRRIDIPHDWPTPMAVAHYLGVEGSWSGLQDGLLYWDSAVRLSEVTDGTSTTLLIGERPPSPDLRFGWWYAGAGFDPNWFGTGDGHLGARTLGRSYRTPTCSKGPHFYQSSTAVDPCGTFHFWSRHPGGANFLFADGAVQFIQYAGEPLLIPLATRAGGEAVSRPE